MGIRIHLRLGKAKRYLPTAEIMAPAGYPSQVSLVIKFLLGVA